MEPNDCVFCKIIRGDVPSTMIAESESVIVIKDISPKAPVHYLIIPKKHLSDVRQFDDKDLEIAGQMILMAKNLSATLPEPGDFKLVMNNGSSAGQCVFHAHMHFLSGKKSIDL